MGDENTIEDQNGEDDRLIDNTPRKCPDDHPDRCQGVTQNGQCVFFSMKYSKYCKIHGGNSAQQAAIKNKYHDYVLQVYQERVDSFSGSAKIKNLHGEVGILRMTLEQLLNNIKQPNHFPLFSDKIGNLADKIHKIVNDIQKMDEKTGQMLDKDALLTLVDTMVVIITKYVTDADILELLSKEISDAILAIGSGSTIQERSKS